jgi:hypothetical protein
MSLRAVGRVVALQAPRIETNGAHSPRNMPETPP